MEIEKIKGLMRERGAHPMDDDYDGTLDLLMQVAAQARADAMREAIQVVKAQSISIELTLAQGQRQMQNRIIIALEGEAG